MSENRGLSALFASWREGDAAALEQLLPLLYGELKAIAGRELRKERGPLTLQTTALVHEAYLRLFGKGPLPMVDRGHFFALATQTMRRVLVDQARRGNAGRRPPKKRRGDWAEAEATPAPESARDDTLAAEILALDGALARLATLDPRQAQVVEMRFFGGMTLDETAAALGFSEATVTREWRSARAWLKAELGASGLGRLT